MGWRPCRLTVVGGWKLAAEEPTHGAAQVGLETAVGAVAWHCVVCVLLHAVCFCVLCFNTPPEAVGIDMPFCFKHAWCFSMR